MNSNNRVEKLQQAEKAKILLNDILNPIQFMKTYSVQLTVSISFAVGTYTMAQ